MSPSESAHAAALARLYDLDVAGSLGTPGDPGDIDLYLALANRVAGPVVELCIGSGRIAVALALAGHKVTGVDHDPAMLERAAARAVAAGLGVGAGPQLVRGDLFDADVIGRAMPRATFSLGIIGLNSLLLLGGPRRQRQAIQLLAGLLEPGGLAVVDILLPFADDLARFDGRLAFEWLRREPEADRDVIKTTAAWYDSGTRAVTLTTIFDEGRQGEPVTRWTREDVLHLLAADELQMYAEDAGLEVEVMAGDYALSALEPGDGRAVMVARRPAAP